MSDNASKLWEEISKHSNRLTGMKIMYPADDRDSLKLAVLELLELGYIEETGKVIGGMMFVVTDYGAQFLEP